jgi:hypothetical protein
MRAAPAAVLLALLVLAPAASAHADVGIELQAREDEDCLDGERCLELVALPPDLEPGHGTALQLTVHPNASQAYRVALTGIGEADPAREATPVSAAVAVTPRADPGETVQVNLTTPSAEAGYAWLPDEDHEAAGGWETVPLGASSSESTSRDDTPLGLAAGTLALVAAAIAGGRPR